MVFFNTNGDYDNQAAPIPSHENIEVMDNAAPISAYSLYSKNTARSVIIPSWHG